jgi:hypothetical protein
MLENEVAPVIKALMESGIEVVAFFHKKAPPEKAGLSLG